MAANWTITNQRQTTDLGPDGRFTDVMEVSFRVEPVGTVGHVMIPLTRYSAESVRDAVEQRVEAILAVNDL